MKTHTKSSITSRRSGAKVRTRSTHLAGVWAAVMLPIIAVPERASADNTHADGYAQVLSVWDPDARSHPDVLLTIGDYKRVDLGFQNSSSSTLALSVGGSQTVADVLDPGLAPEVNRQPISWSVSATAEAGGSASMGTLGAWARATAAQSPTRQTYSYIFGPDRIAGILTKYHPIQVSGTARAWVGWEDVLTITSPTLASGTPIEIRFTVVLDSTVQNPSSSVSTMASAYLSRGEVVAQVHNYGGASVNTKHGTIGSAVGRSLKLHGSLLADAAAYGSFGFMDAFALAMNTGHFYFDLDPGIDASIVSQSGTSYATPPALNIQSAGNNVLISWPATAQGYQLETTASLGAGNQWVAVTNTPALAGPQNVLTISISSSERFYRLKK